MTKEIRLCNSDLVAIVDDEDYNRIIETGYKWRAIRNKSTHYAAAFVTVGGKLVAILMHRYILGLSGRRPLVDHKDGYGLNNQKSNLRKATHLQNMANCKKRKSSKWPYKGIFFDARCQKWRARIRINGKQKKIGSFQTPEEAAIAYDEKARAIFGKFARLNFPSNGEGENANIVTDQKDDTVIRTNRVRLVTINGKTQRLLAWCEELGIPKSTVFNRIYRKGMSDFDALMTPRLPPNGGGRHLPG